MKNIISRKIYNEWLRFASTYLSHKYFIYTNVDLVNLSTQLAALQLNTSINKLISES